MKKLLLMTIALLAFGATIAAAQDKIDISWGGGCRTAVNNTSVSLNNQSSTIGGVPCDGITDPMGLSPARTLTMRFQPTTALPDFSGTTVEVELTSPAGFPPGSIWDFSAVGCNAGAVSAKATAAAASCTSPYAGDTQGNATNVNQKNN